MDEVMYNAATSHKEMLVMFDKMRTAAHKVATKYFMTNCTDKTVGQIVDMSSMNQCDVVFAFPLMTHKLTMGQLTDMSIELRNEMAAITGRSYNECIHKVQVFYHNINADRISYKYDSNIDLQSKFNCGPREYIVQGKPYLGIGMSLFSSFVLGRVYNNNPLSDVVSYVEFCKRKTQLALQEGKEYIWTGNVSKQPKCECDDMKQHLAGIDGFDAEQVSTYYADDQEYISRLEGMMENSRWDMGQDLRAEMQKEVERVRNVWWRLGIQL